jgi:hypothetical protein
VIDKLLPKIPAEYPVEPMPKRVLVAQARVPGELEGVQLPTQVDEDGVVWREVTADPARPIPQVEQPVAQSAAEPSASAGVLCGRRWSGWWTVLTPADLA